jgi:DNA invertase Pin-like site-specific DNA recombinase
MNGIIYTRVSSKEQVVDRTSLASQEKECLAFARKSNATVLEESIFREEGESAKFADRTQLQNMLEYVRTHKGQVEVLYIWKIDRLSRNLGDYYGIKVALNRYGVKIVSVTEPIDDDPVGRFLEAILAAAAQFDNEIRAIRTVTGMRIRVEQGGWPHSAPIGYMKKDKRVVFDPNFGPIIKDILIKFSGGGYTLADISQYAFDKGIHTKSGRPKASDAVKRILQNPMYAGFTKNKLAESMTKGLHKAMVSPEIIQANIDLISGNKRNYSFQGDDLYPLKNILHCSNCGMKLLASQPRSHTGDYHPMYHCNRKTCRRAVTGKRASIGIDKAHEDFRRVLRALKPLDTGIAKLYKDFVVKAWNDQYKNSIDNIARLNRDIESYRDLRQKTNEKYIGDKITEADRDMQYRTIDTRLSVLENDLEETTQYMHLNESIVDNSMQFIKDPELFWNRASTSVKQMIQLLLFPNGVVYDFETGYGTFDKLESYLLLQKMTDKSVKISDLVVATGIEPVTSSL